MVMWQQTATRVVLYNIQRGSSATKSVISQTFACLHLHFLMWHLKCFIIHIFIILHCTKYTKKNKIWNVHGVPKHVPLQKSAQVF